MKAALVIMAAGMGSRYGGSKQVDGIGPNGEILMEYSVFDALRAGFTKVVFIIKPEMRELMEELVGKRLARRKTADGENVEVCYAYQDFSSVPSFYQVPEERVKPFGTVHALLCARECVSEPFVVINADDYYGVDAFRTIYAALSKLAETGEGTMVGYDLCNTVSEHGTVTRGVCATENGLLRKVHETYKIQLCPDGTIRDTSGAGAGGYPTGSSVLRDCLDIADGCRSFYADSFVPRSVNLSGMQGKWLFRCMGETFVRECSAREAFDAYESYRKDDPHALLARYAVDEE